MVTFNKNYTGGGIILRINSRSQPEILLVKQRLNKLWGLPKGHILPNEEIFTGALREIKEETGLDFNRMIIGQDFLMYSRLKYFQLNFWIFILNPSVSFQPPITMEIEDHKWISLSPVSTISALQTNRTLNISFIKKIKKECKTIIECLPPHFFPPLSNNIL